MTLLQDRAVMSPTGPAARVMFLFVGGGAKRAKLEREAMKRTLTNFRVSALSAQGATIGNFGRGQTFTS